MKPKLYAAIVQRVLNLIFSTELNNSFRIPASQDLSNLKKHIYIFFSQLALLNRDRFTDRTIRQEEYILVVKYTHPMYGTSYTKHWLEVRIPLGTELSQCKVYRIKHLHASLTRGLVETVEGQKDLHMSPKLKYKCSKQRGGK